MGSASANTAKLPYALLFWQHFCYSVNVKQQKYEYNIETGRCPTYKLPASSKNKDSS